MGLALVDYVMASESTAQLEMNDSFERSVLRRSTQENNKAAKKCISHESTKGMVAHRQWRQFTRITEVRQASVSFERVKPPSTLLRRLTAPVPRQGNPMASLNGSPPQAHAQARETPADNDGRADRSDTIRAYHAPVRRRRCCPLQRFLLQLVFVFSTRPVAVRIHIPERRVRHSRTVVPVLPPSGSPTSLAMQYPVAATRTS